MCARWCGTPLPVGPRRVKDPWVAATAPHGIQMQAARNGPTYERWRYCRLSSTEDMRHALHMKPTIRSILSAHDSIFAQKETRATGALPGRLCGDRAAG